MKLVAQRAKSAQCSVGDQVVGEIGHGLVTFVGVESYDTPRTAEETAEMISSLRVFEGDGGHLDRSSRDVNAELLLVPNFTICAAFSSGGRPSFDAAASPDHAEDLFKALIEEVSKRFATVESGRFGADMDVSVENDGPVTVTLEV